MRKVMICGATLIALVCGSPMALAGTHSSHSTRLVSTKKASKHSKKHSKKQHKHKTQSHAAK